MGAKWGNMRSAFGEALVEAGHRCQQLVVIDADISKSTCTDEFARAFPDRSFNMGVAEQNAVTVAAGLSTVGLLPVVSTYAVFASMRACEEVRTFVCYPHLNVKIVASHGGMQVGGDGVTHQGLEDLALMRSLPGMTVVHPCDAPSTRRALEAILDARGPVYMRLCRNDIPTISSEDDEFVLGKGRVWVSDPRDEATIVATGVMVSRALRAAEELKRRGIPTRVVEVHTLKPLDRELVARCARETGRLVTAEDHNIVGALGSAVAEVIAEEGCGARLKRIGLNDVFAESGPGDELLDKYGLGVQDIVAAVEALLRA